MLFAQSRRIDRFLWLPENICYERVSSLENPYLCLVIFTNVTMEMNSFLAKMAR